MTKWQGGWAIGIKGASTIPRYISFGEHLEGPGTDSFGVSDEKIFCYSNADEVQNLRIKVDDDGWRMVAWIPVEAGAPVVALPILIAMPTQADILDIVNI